MGITHLGTHRGKTKKLRTQTSNPTTPTVVTGDIYVNKTTGREAIGIYGASGWLYLSLQV
jgi:hypothetical protein